MEESRQLAEEDRKGAELDKEKQLQQRSHMMRYRDNNKMVSNILLLKNSWGIVSHAIDWFSPALYTSFAPIKTFHPQ